MKLYTLALFLISFNSLAANPKIQELCSEYTRVTSLYGSLSELAGGKYNLKFNDHHSWEDDLGSIDVVGYKLESEDLDLDSIETNHEQFVFFDKEGKKVELSFKKTLIITPNCPGNNPRGACESILNVKPSYLLDYTIKSGNYEKTFKCKKNEIGFF